MAWEESFGITLNEAEAAEMFTTGQVVDFIHRKIRSPDANEPEDTGCLALRAYFRLKRALISKGVDAANIRADAKLSDLLPGSDRRRRVSAILIAAGFPALPRMPFGLQFTFGRLRDYVLDCVISHHGVLRRPGTTWSRQQVREVVRAVMRAQLAMNRFSDDALLVRDLGID